MCGTRAMRSRSSSVTCSISSCLTGIPKKSGFFELVFQRAHERRLVGQGVGYHPNTRRRSRE